MENFNKTLTSINTNQNSNNLENADDDNLSMIANASENLNDSHGETTETVYESPGETTETADEMPQDEGTETAHTSVENPVQLIEISEKPLNFYQNQVIITTVNIPVEPIINSHLKSPEFNIKNCCRLIVLWTHVLAQVQKVEITNLNKNPGILPFKLGNARVKVATHTFLHYYDLIPISNQISILNQQYDDVTKAIEKGLSSPYFYALQNFNRGILFQLESVKNKFNSVYPFYDDKRVKRGLINGLGSIIKSISGNLDQEDAERYNKAIEHLQNKQQQIISQVNTQISLTTEILDNYNKTITLVLHNQDVIVDGIEKIKKDFNKFIFNFSHYMQTRDVLDQLSSSLSMLLHLLTNIENAISFSKLGSLHHSILKTNEMESIIEKLLKFHSNNQIIFSDRNSLYKYYDVVQVKAFYSNKRLIFALEFPLVHPDQFSHYHLYSIPTVNSTTIIPENTYLTMSSDSYQYQSTPCSNMGPVYYCEDNRLIDGIRKNDCIFSMLQLHNDNISCQQTPVSLSSHFVEEKIQTKCGMTDFTTLHGNYLIILPPGCEFRTLQYIYSNEKEIMESQPLLLPEVKLSTTQLNTTNIKLNIKDVPLDQLHKIQQKQQLMKPINPNSFLDGPSVWSLPLYVIILLFAIIVIGYKIWKYKKSSYEKKEEKTPASKSMEKTDVKVLFIPDKTSL
ncbi:hypothetical protein NQ317_013197 [Molorchus minor]|uniref:Envelope fusion protein n=1 Tax=Molorchus minor TaxID=1323400 RepID=A0ABQ9K1Q7_9CUCU|nr:hypothetical protein NQ317_013197 [Molorchus minor]